MKALVYTGPGEMAFRDAPDPAPGPGDELIRVERVGICGSDMHGYLGHDDRRPAPLILGHEAAGVILGGARDGERVTVNPLVLCGTCPSCRAGIGNLCHNRQIISMPPREGAFAEYLAMPAGNLVTLPDDMSFEVAAMAEPLAVCWHAVKLGLETLRGPRGRALVIGGGAIGVGSALCLTAMGVASVTLVEPNDARRAFAAEKVGLATATPDDVATESFDIVVDAVGYDGTRASASARARPGGVIVHIGLGGGAGGLDIRRLTLQEIAFIGTYCYTPDEFRETVAAMHDGRLGALDWAETRPLAEGAGAFADIRSGAVAAPKIILNPTA